jgi:hypothetical protein
LAKWIGTAARAVSITPLNAIVFATFAKSMRVMEDNKLLVKSTPSSSSSPSPDNGSVRRELPNYGRLAVAGIAAGFVQSFISSPAELVLLSLLSMSWYELLNLSIIQ